MDTHEEMMREISPKDEFTDMLEGMTKQELVKYASMTFGLNVTAKYNKHELVAAIKDAKSKFQLNEELITGKQLEDDLKPGYAEIRLHRTDMTKGMKSIIVGLNGSMASLPIDETFALPLELLHILQNSIRIEYEQDNSVDPPLLVEREVHAYPFTIFKMNPHTGASLKAAKRKRGLKSRPY